MYKQGLVPETRSLSSYRMSRLSLACRAWSRVLADLLAIALLGTLELGVYLAEERGVVAERRGFYCDDTSIRLPFRHSTVPGWALALCSVAVPFFAVSLTEAHFKTFHAESCRGYNNDK